MNKSISTTKLTIKLMFFYLLSLAILPLLMYIIDSLNNIMKFNTLFLIAILILSCVISTTIIPNIIIKKLLKNKTITTKDYKNIKKNIIIAFLILLIGVLIYKIPNYIKDLNEVSKELNDFINNSTNLSLHYDSMHIIEDKLAFLKIDIKFEIIRVLYTFGISIYFLINNIKNYINSNKNIKKFYIKRIIILIVTFSIYLCLNIIPGLFNHVH